MKGITVKMMKIMILNKKEKIVNMCKTYKNSEIVKKLHDLVFENNLFFLGHFQVGVPFFFFFFFMTGSN